MKDLILHLKGEYFDEIKRGIKPYEFRLDTDYWRKRLIGREYENVIFCRGYPAASEAVKRIVEPYRGYEMQTITHKHFDNKPERVFAIRTMKGTRA